MGAGARQGQQRWGEKVGLVCSAIETEQETEIPCALGGPSGHVGGFPTATSRYPLGTWGTPWAHGGSAGWLAVDFWVGGLLVGWFVGCRVWLAAWGWLVGWLVATSWLARACWLVGWGVCVCAPGGAIRTLTPPLFFYYGSPPGTRNGVPRGNPCTARYF